MLLVVNILNFNILNNSNLIEILIYKVKEPKLISIYLYLM
jgi:hypothetical protein